jgi:hypothetical protein
MVKTPQGQVFYPQEAEAMFPGGCECPDDSGSCDYCRIYYDGPPDDYEEASA